MVLAVKLSCANAALAQSISSAGRTGVSPQPFGESSKVAEESSGTFDTLIGNIKPIVTNRSSEKILEDVFTEEYNTEDITENQPSRLSLPRDRCITSTEESHRWKYSTRDVDPPFDPKVTGLPTTEARIKFAKQTQVATEVYSKVPISCIKTLSLRSLYNNDVKYAQFSVLRKDGIVYTFTDADFHLLCVYDLPFLFQFLAKRMELGNKYADSQSSYESSDCLLESEDFDFGYWLGQNKLYISPSNSRPLWIKDVEPNTFVEEPSYGFIYEDWDGVKRFFDHLECNKYMHKSLKFVYKALSKEVQIGRINRELATPLLSTIEATAKFRSLLYNISGNLPRPWIWHAFLGCAGAMNDPNVLNHSPLFEDVYDGKAPDRTFQVNRATYKHRYYLVDGKTLNELSLRGRKNWHVKISNELSASSKNVGI
ncbi:hypothetical protein OSB04_002328 [Centaurea solstitialis]|uniref:Uncharacterized protein n=1 Tax=Centaurea solstitialis TaxID=347529 RepID=A0AA38WMN7_9ASTR|nr:hypothetical protein OSB04_002328 [Centaurea solstitialis]